MPITSDQLVDDIMRRWPQTIRVFLDHRFHCVGCPIGCFHTVEDACREHHVDPGVFLAALKGVEDGEGPQARCGAIDLVR